jgi:uncharacterized protein YhfF
MVRFIGVKPIDPYPTVAVSLRTDPLHMKRETLDVFWNRYVASDRVRELQGDRYETDTFGDTPDEATELGRLVARGRKTASCSSVWEWEADGKLPPNAGDRTIVLDGRGLPICIIETTEVETRKFCEVDEQLAYDEGEDDRSLEAWRRIHWEFFSRGLPRIGRQPSQDMPLVCERFRVIFT